LRKEAALKVKPILIGSTVLVLKLEKSSFSLHAENKTIPKKYKRTLRKFEDIGRKI
jgi:hypothetical protein